MPRNHRPLRLAAWSESRIHNYKKRITYLPTYLPRINFTTFPQPPPSTPSLSGGNAATAELMALLHCATQDEIMAYVAQLRKAHKIFINATVVDGQSEWEVLVNDTKKVGPH